MAKIFPDIYIKEPGTESGAEHKVFKKAALLNDDWAVWHSWRWRRDKHEKIRGVEGECDFIFLHRHLGMLAIEVKGGIISYKSNQWYSNGKKIQDPIAQVRRSKFKLINTLSEAGLRDCFVADGVWFPDCQFVSSIASPQLNESFCLDSLAIQAIEESLIYFLRTQREMSHVQYEMSVGAFERIIECLNADFNFTQTLCLQINNAREQIIELEKSQKMAYSMLSSTSFGAVRGRAGTGKTILAINLGLRKALQDKRVLYLCYNARLSEAVANQIAPQDLPFTSLTLHKLGANLKIWSQQYDKQSESYEATLQKIIELKHLIAKKFDVVLLDEAQDIEQNIFEALKSLHENNLCFYYFYDDCQFIKPTGERPDFSYLKHSSELTLTLNMRNSVAIHQAALKLLNAENHSLFESNGIPGPEIRVSVAENQEKLEDCMMEIHRQLVHNERVHEKQITLLSLHGAESSSLRDNRVNMPVETIRKYKGLENDIIIIFDVDYKYLTEEGAKNILYTAMTRARSMVYIIFSDEPGPAKNQVKEMIKPYQVPDGSLAISLENWFNEILPVTPLANINTSIE